MATYTNYVDLRTVELGEKTWIQLAKLGEYKHPLHGALKFTTDKFKQFVDNFKKNVRGIDIDIDYSHKNDPAHGHEAAGWLKDVKVDGDTLYGLVEFTDDAVTDIKGKKYRYFSPEYADEWTDANGVTHNNVLLGGGITNRPFLKNLMPINLSELSFNEPDLSNKKENEVDPKQLRASVGLAEDASDEELATRLGLIKQLGEAFPNGAPQVTPPKVETPPAPPAPAFQLTEDIKTLSENNPQVKALLTFVESTVQANKDNAVKLREQNVAMKLTEFDKSGLVLTPTAREAVSAIMLDEAMTPALSEKIWAVLADARNSNKFFIQLGEIGSSATAQRLVSGVTATDKYNGLVKQLMEQDKLGYADAAIRVSQAHPQLMEDYRQESFAFKE